MTKSAALLAAALLSLLLRLDTCAAQCTPAIAQFFSTAPNTPTFFATRQTVDLNIDSIWQLSNTTALAFEFRAKVETALKWKNVIEWGVGSNADAVLLVRKTVGVFRYQTASGGTVSIVLANTHLLNFDSDDWYEFLFVIVKSTGRILVYVNSVLTADTGGNPASMLTSNIQVRFAGSANTVLVADALIYNSILTPGKRCPEQCIPNVQQLFSTDPSAISNVESRTSTGVQADLVMSTPSATAFAVSGRVEFTRTTVDNYRKFIDFNSAVTGTSVSFGLSIGVLTIRRQTGITSSFITSSFHNFFYGTGDTFDFLYMIYKSTKRAVLWLNGIRVIDTDTNGVGWLGTQAYDLTFEFASKLSNVVIYDQIVSPTTKCTLCVAGEFGRTCKPCVAGEYGIHGDSFCTSCMPNSNSPPSSRFLSNCTCNPGFSGQNAGHCAPCVAGKYKIAAGNGACTDCQALTFSNAVGATSNVCQNCPSDSVAVGATYCACNTGFVMNFQGICTQCTAGTYKGTPAP